MPPETSTPSRVVRSLATAVVCTGTATTAHGAVGGQTSPGATVLVLAGVAGVAAALSGRRIGTGQFAGLLVLAQAALHLASSGPTEPHGPAMVAVHVVATAVSAAVLTRGESFVWSLVTRVLLASVPRVPAVRVATCPAPAVVRQRVLRSAAVVLDRGMRGPPVRFA